MKKKKYSEEIPDIERKILLVKNILNDVYEIILLFLRFSLFNDVN